MSAPRNPPEPEPKFPSPDSDPEREPPGPSPVPVRTVEPGPDVIEPGSAATGLIAEREGERETSGRMVELNRGERVGYCAIRLKGETLLTRSE